MTRTLSTSLQARARWWFVVVGKAMEAAAAAVIIIIIKEIPSGQLSVARAAKYFLRWKKKESHKLN